MKGNSIPSDPTEMVKKVVGNEHTEKPENLELYTIRTVHLSLKKENYAF